ncbi:MAG: uracil-DNA glycosylase [Gemmataceae bacterium]
MPGGNTKPAASAKTTPKTTPAPAPVATAEPGRLERLLPEDWRKALAAELKKPYFRQLEQFIASERQAGTVCPDESSIFSALELTPRELVRVVIVGQEPSCYSDVADGMAFSVREGVEPSEMLRTIGREIRRDLGLRLPTSGSLKPWARQGVLLLNSVLSVREGQPGSHKGKGWETFTDGILKMLSDTAPRTVFAFWGTLTDKRRALIDDTRHDVLSAEHPAMSPDDFLGSGIFSDINTALEMGGRSGVYWQLPYA